MESAEFFVVAAYGVVDEIFVVEGLHVGVEILLTDIGDCGGKITG